MMNRRRWLHTALAGAALAAFGPLSADESHDTIDLDWVDERRQRPVPVRLYRPHAAGPAPLVVFSHGIGGSRVGYSYLGRHFASHGVASLHLQHVGSDRSLWTGNVLSLVGRLQTAARDDEAIARVGDLGYALDRLLAGEHGAGIDPRRIVAAGHSYGANTTLLAAGAQVPRGDRLLSLRDPRVMAAIVISAPPFYGESDLRPILGGIQVPSLHITATEDVIRIPGYYSGAEDRVAVFDAVGSARKWLAVFEGGSHSIFTDRSGTGGPALNPQVKQATRELALAFVQQTCGLSGGDIDGCLSRHQGLLARWTVAQPAPAVPAVPAG